MSIGNDRYEYNSPRCADCEAYPKSEYELGDWHSCRCDSDVLRCEGCASTHKCICPHCNGDCGYEMDIDVCSVYEAARAEAR